MLPNQLKSSAAELSIRILNRFFLHYFIIICIKIICNKLFLNCKLLCRWCTNFNYLRSARTGYIDWCFDGNYHISHLHRWRIWPSAQCPPHWFRWRKNLELVDVHRPNAQRMRIGFFKLHLEEQRGHCDSICFLMFSMGGRQREERQLKVPDFDDDLSFNPVAGDDKFILDDSIWKKVIQNYDVILATLKLSMLNLKKKWCD